VSARSQQPALKASSRAEELYPLLLLVALVFVVVFPWHAVNQRLPIWDGADFVLTSQKIADAFNERFVAGLRALYMERGWRPIIFPNLAAPFFLLSGGQIRLSVGLTQFAFALIMALYVYGFLRQEYSSKRALTGTLLILGAPWLVNFSQLFYSELLWLAATAGTVYHLSAALRESSRSHYVLTGVWLGLMGATRPVETVVVVFVPAVTFLAYAVRRGIVKAVDIGLFGIQLLTAAMAVGLLVMPEGNGYLILSLLGTSMVIIGLRVRRLLVDSPLLVALVCAELIALAWHVSTIRALYLWAESTSFGIWAQLAGPSSRVPLLAIPGQLLEAYSPRLLLAVVVLALAGAPGLLRSSRNVLHSGARILVGTAALMIVPMLVLYSLSATSDPRRIMPGMFILYMGVTAAALTPRGHFPRVRLACLLGLAVSLVAAATANGLNVPSDALLRVQGTFGYLRRPALGQDPNGPVLESLLKLGLSNGNIAAYTRCYRGYEQCERNNLPPFEPMALSTLARERHVPLFVHYVHDLDFSRPETLSKQIQAYDFQYVLIDMADLPGPFNRADPYANHTEHFISMERTELPAGMVRRGCFSTLNRPICVAEVAR
jgi:hypothetical protein